jgi:hypothetical protein
MREARRKFPGWRRTLLLLYILVDELKNYKHYFVFQRKK